MTFRSKILTKIIIIALFCACPTLALAVTPPIPAQPSQYVVDLDSGARDGLK